MPMFRKRETCVSSTAYGENSFSRGCRIGVRDPPAQCRLCSAEGSFGVFLREEARAWGFPAFPERKAAASRSRPCQAQRGSAMAPLTSSRHLGSAPGPRPPEPPDSPAHWPRFTEPAAFFRSAGTPGGAATGSRVGGQAGARARAAGPPGAGEGGCSLSSPGRVNALHLGLACGWGPFPSALGPGYPSPRALTAGQVGPPRFPVREQGGAGAGGEVGAGAGGGVSGPAGPSLVNILFC
ncbi:translation initiation factor IF-2-like [Lemur catta]|uniref:translation initiation factor IF-2-like n=1 Tax=Lemur catta TaxID=9447 RepID=UPI001E2692DA|nr:translation initiation factor IF-2-like [Lemur catta]